jgi:hypothetical protein
MRLIFALSAQKIKRIPKVTFMQRGSTAANVACPM